MGRGEAGGTSSHQHRQEGSSTRVALRQHSFTPYSPAREALTGEFTAARQVEIGERNVLQHRDVTCRALGEWGRICHFEERSMEPI